MLQKLSVIIIRMPNRPVSKHRSAFVHRSSLGDELGNRAVNIGLTDHRDPFLIQQGFIIRTPKGREATDKAFAHCGATPPER